MTDFLVPEKVLQEAVGARRAIYDKGSSEAQSFPLPSRYAYGWYRLFCDPERLEALGLSRLSDDHMFYNKYFWFLVFSNCHQRVRGYDAGIEQQAFKMLEEAPPDIDWKRIEQIAQRAEERAAISDD